MGKIDRNSIEAARSLTGGLKAKSRRRRESLKRLAGSSSLARATRNDLLPPLDLVYVLLEDLRTPGREVRKLDPAHVREVANSIRTLGFCAPVLVGKDNLVLDGALRVQAARLLGLGRAPCTRIEYLSEKEERVLRLAVNRPHWLFRHPRSEPDCTTWSFPHQINLTFGCRSQRLHQYPACSRWGSIFESGST